MNELTWRTIGLVQQGFAIVWVFGWAAFFLVLRRWKETKRQRRIDLVHQERMAAMEKGIPLPEMPDYDEEPRPGPFARMRLNSRWPLGLGAFSIVMGAGTSIVLRMSGDPYHNQVWPFGLLGVFFGFGLFLYYGLTRTDGR
jgi:hypothetical protein